MARLQLLNLFDGVVVSSVFGEKIEILLVLNLSPAVFYGTGHLQCDSGIGCHMSLGCKPSGRSDFI